jgi:hypothetical protein
MPIPNTPYYGGAEMLPMFQPALRNILSITNAPQAVITTTFDGVNPGVHQYHNGLIIRLLVPKGFGMVQANQLYGTVTVIDDTSFSVDIDTTLMDPFVVPTLRPGAFFTPAQSISFAEINSIITEARKNVLPYP